MSYSNQHLFVDDVRVGQIWETPRRTITETDIVNFAGLSGDFNPIHMDHEFAASTPFGQPIAHGLLVFSIASGLLAFSPPMRTLAFMTIKNWHFRHPIKIGDTIHVRSKIVDIEMRTRNRRGIVTWQREILNQDDKIAQEGETTTLVEGRANLERYKKHESIQQTPDTAVG